MNEKVCLVYIKIKNFYLSKDIIGWQPRVGEKLATLTDKELLPNIYKYPLKPIKKKRDNPI